MKPSPPHTFRQVFALVATGIVFAIVCWLGGSWLTQSGSVEAKLNGANAVLTRRPIQYDLRNPKVQAAVAAQRRHTPDLMAYQDVVGTAAAVDNLDEPTVLVYTRKAMSRSSLPESVDGIPVEVKVTGDIIPMAVTGVDNYYPRPVPVGASVGNRGECSAGTIGARVIDSQNKVYALSNNHVLALENHASIGSLVLQPGLYDLNCVYNKVYKIGTLYDFEPISFTRNNTIDAAIALTNRTKLSNFTPSKANGGYSRPKSATMAAVINQKVMKFGRTTGLTHGTVTAINGTFLVGYDAGDARFVNQIVVRSSSPFILPGDSGSLLVTDPKKYPVGLLFAGNSAGTMAIANPIDPVLERFGVTIDGYTPPVSPMQ